MVGRSQAFVAATALSIVALGAVLFWTGHVPGLSQRNTSPHIENPSAGLPTSADRAVSSQTRSATNEAPGGPSEFPSFDVVRVEPTGETVIAGRGVPGATIDMLRNGNRHAQ